jgi:Skp family chaperone for outer membrane proteins
MGFIMKKILMLMLFVFGMAFSTTQSQAQAVKVGVVDVITILKEMPDAKVVDKELQEIGLKWQDTLMTMQKDLEAKIEQYRKQKTMMPADQQAKTEAELQALNQNLMQYNQEKFGQQGELAIIRDQKLEPIREKVKSAIEKVSKEEKLNLVIEKTSMILYFDDAMEITYKVLDVIKRGAK